MDFAQSLENVRSENKAKAYVRPRTAKNNKFFIPPDFQLFIVYACCLLHYYSSTMKLLKAPILHSVAILLTNGIVDAFAPLVGLSQPLVATATIKLAAATAAAAADQYELALLFDCDGVILETEEFHRLAYNAAFQNADLTIAGELVEWSVEYYGE